MTAIRQSADFGEIFFANLGVDGSDIVLVI